MIKKIHSILNELEPTYYHYEYRPYNFKEACLIVLGLALGFCLLMWLVVIIIL